MIALAEPSEAPVESARVSDSVSPVQAAGKPETTTDVMLPPLSTERTALSALTPQEVTAAFPAESFFEPSPRLVAAPQAADIAATARANPSRLASRFMISRVS